MTRVVALVAWSNGNVTMEEKGVYEIDDALATDLIAQGLCADAATYFGGGGSGGGVLVVTDTEGTLDKTWQEIFDAFATGNVRITYGETDIGSVLSIAYSKGEYGISCNKEGSGTVTYSASSASSYPVFVE